MDEKNNFCLGCPASCCHSIVDVTVFDIARIALLNPSFDFITALKASDDDLYAFKAQKRLVKFVLRRRNESCVFLDSSKELKCGIHECRPRICTIYPFHLKNQKIALQNSIPCSSGSRQKATACSISEQTLEDYLWECKQYSDILRDWNSLAKGDETIRDFFMFALEEMNLEASIAGSLFRKFKRPFLKVMDRL